LSEQSRWLQNSMAVSVNTKCTFVCR
jgi:hypothetical protein